jgi:hypothetical protein
MSTTTESPASTYYFPTSDEGVRACPTFVIYADQRQEIVRQVGRMNILAASGGKITGIIDGIELPDSRTAYKVRVRLTPSDTYTVQRVFIRGGKEFLHGERHEVDPHELGEAVYYASSFVSYDKDEWVTK